MKGSADQLSDGNGHASEARTGDHFHCSLQKVGLHFAHGLQLGKGLILASCGRWEDP